MTSHRTITAAAIATALALSACGSSGADAIADTTVSSTTGAPRPVDVTTTAAIAITPSPKPTTPATTAAAGDWRADVTAMCDRAVSVLTSVPAADGTAAGIGAAVAAHRAARRQTLAVPSRVPAEVLDGPNGVIAVDAAQEAALEAAERAVAVSDVAGARSALDAYLFNVLKMGNVFAVAGARCGGADPSRAVGAALNVPFEFSPLNVTAGFGSIWVTEHDGRRVARVDPATGQVIATVDAGVEPVKLQPADGRMWGRTADAFFAIDPTTNTVTATLAKADVGPAADRAWAVPGGLWVCDGQRLHRLDTASLEPIAVIELGIPCDLVGGTSELIVASTYNGDAEQSGASAAAFVDPSTNRLLATVDLPVDVTVGIVLDDAVFFPGENGSKAVVVDRATWTTRSTPDLGRPTGALGTVEADATSVYVPTLDQRDVLVVDTTTFDVVDTVETLGVHSVTVQDGSLWVAFYDGFLQRFDRGDGVP